MRCPTLPQDTPPVVNNTTNTEQVDNAPPRVPARNNTVDYSEYMWMGGDIEEFDRKVVEECLEEEFIERCFEEMHQEEEVMYNLERAIEQHPDLLNNNWVQAVAVTPIQVTDVFIFNPEVPEFIPRENLPQR